MPPTPAFSATRSWAIRSRPLVRPVIGTKRNYAAQNDPSKLPKAEKDQAGPNMQQQEHVSEEAAKMAKIQGKEGPDIEGQGTPVQEIIQDEKDVRKQAPQVMKQEAKSGTAASSASSTSTGGARSFSTLARRRLEMHNISPPAEFLPSLMPSAAPSPTPQDSATTTPSRTSPDPQASHKFPLPPLPLPSTMHKDRRHEPIVDQVTNLMMRHGKKSVAQRNMSVILSHLRTAPPPTYSPTRPLMPGAPPASHLPLNPILYLTLAIDSVAPLLRIRSLRGQAGGGAALQIPVPLALRQRRRQAFAWILDAVAKKQNRGSGRDMFATRVAQELIAVVEGTSSVWERRQGVHRLGTSARVNLNFGRQRRR